MSTDLLHAPIDTATTSPTSRFVLESGEALLADEAEELAALRFSTILTARWADSSDEEPERRAELREELSLLRKRYGDKIDEIAMGFGVEQAMKIKDEVERTVVVPRSLRESIEAENADEDADNEFGL